MASERGRESEEATDVRSFYKTPDAAEEGIGATFLNVTQHLFHIYDGGAALPMPPSTTGAILSAPDYPRYPPMHNL